MSSGISPHFFCRATARPKTDGRIGRAKIKNRFQGSLEAVFQFEPNPRLNFAALILSLLLAAGALAKMRKSLRDTRTEIKKPLAIACSDFSLSFLRLATLSHLRAESET